MREKEGNHSTVEHYDENQQLLQGCARVGCPRRRRSVERGSRDKGGANTFEVLLDWIGAVSTETSDS